ncbi:MAG: hypothetical protein M3Y21_07890 [Candidatus Eremiobacteraeota bacterium]|nr:hypothetical protein [Candidatus Eremiobacteraeota bacterium]
MTQPAGFQNIIAHLQITRVEVLHAPDQLQTRVALSPGNLSRYATSIYDTTDPTKISTLVDAMKQTAMTPSVGKPDVRWGVVLKTSQTRESTTLYLDKFGTSALAAGTQVQLSGQPIIAVLQQQFSAEK